MSLRTSDDLLAGYRPAAGAWDDMVDGGGRLREEWSVIGPALDGLGLHELRRRQGDTARLLAADGVTYNAYGDDGGLEDRWLLDPLPSVIGPRDWAALEAGVAQRAQLLDLVLGDLYGERDLVRRGLVAPEVVFGHPGFLRPWDGVRQGGPSQLFLHAANVARDAGGAWVVLSDQTQAPSGMGYALENRVVVSRVLAGVFRDAGVQRLAPFFRSLRAGLQAAAPAAVEDPTIVVLSPGPRAETAFEHGLLARHLGYPLVEGSDLTMRDGRVWMRSLGRPVAVHVILRRVDAWYCDPLELKGDSHLGVPGLIEACRRGHVSIVNTLGSGVLENPALLRSLPRICEALLGEPLLLPSPAVWWCGDAGERSHVLANLGRLVVRPISFDAGQPSTFGPGLPAGELDDLRRRIEAAPWAWTAQEPVALPSVPTLGTDGVAAGRVVFRTFAVAGPGGWEVMPGGLTRLRNGRAPGSKDTWVLATDGEAQQSFWLQDGPAVAAAEAGAAMSSRVAENLFWLGRYAERAEEVTRLVRVVTDRAIELEETSNPAGHQCLRALLQAVTEVTATHPGFVGDGAERRIASPDAELLRIVVDAGAEGTIAHAVSGLLEAARAVRDQLSGDTWLVVGALGRELADLGLLAGPHPDPAAATQATLGRVMQGLLALTGLVADSMVRDVGWRFLDAGRRIERSVQLLDLLRSTVAVDRGTATDSLLFESVLTSTESIITYRRRYRSHAQLQTLLDLLLLDAGNPRSLVFQLDQLAASLAVLPGGSRSGPAAGKLSEPERLVLEATTALRLADTEALATARDGDHRPDLDAFLARLLDLLGRTADAIDASSFVHLAPQRILG
jgi:uncharacterized circularly permuted ATP-grasp superfamily protein/uncharacterized alpha-E superfamily protein